MKILTLTELDVIILQAKRLQREADRHWAEAAKACVVEVLYRKQNALATRLAELASGETVWRHISRAIEIMTGGCAVVFTDGKPILEYQPSQGVLAWSAKENAWHTYDVEEARYVALRTAYEQQWKTLELRKIVAQDPPKLLSIKAFQDLHARFMKNESLWKPSEREQIRALLNLMNGATTIPISADSEATCATAVASFDGKPKPTLNSAKRGK